MILLRLRGGLGNQMFQYAAGRAMADRLGCPLLFDLRHFPQQKKHTGYALDGFAIRATMATPAELRRWPNALIEIGLRLPALRRFLRTWHFERSFTYDADLAGRRGDLCLIGYWQSERYFHDIAEAIRRDFALRDGDAALDAGLLAAARAGDSVAVHVRRGDYVHDPVSARVHGACSVDYYRRAIDLMRLLRPASRFLVFSDDADWVRRNLPVGEGAVFLEGNASRPELDMALMSECSHHIIANSSFSWWGAWLAHTPEQVVVAPVPWFETSAFDSRDLLVADWIYLRRT